jgi:hypothetical protein
MAKADEKPTPSETPIPISEAAGRVLKFYPVHVAGRKMMKGLAAGLIHCSYDELVGHRPPEPTPDMRAFWQRDPRGKMYLTPFPWIGDWVQRLVYARDYRRPLCDCTGLGLKVMWSEVVAIFPACESVPVPKQTARRGAKPKFTPEKINSSQKWLQNYLDEKPSWVEASQDSLANHVMDQLNLSGHWITVWRNICKPVLDERKSKIKAN